MNIFMYYYFKIIEIYDLLKFVSDSKVVCQIVLLQQIFWMKV